MGSAIALNRRKHWLSLRKFCAWCLLLVPISCAVYLVAEEMAIN
jgi:hypothetical protein